jgi:ssDNA-specific exonuclease RecJ
LALIVIAIIGAILILEKPANYKGHKIFKLMPTSVDDLNTIIRLKKISRVFVKNSFIISFL